jgi:hypothetical protein
MKFMIFFHIHRVPPWANKRVEATPSIPLLIVTILTGFVQIYTGLKPTQQTPTHISQQVTPKFEDSSSMTIEGQSSKIPSKIQKANGK